MKMNRQSITRIGALGAMLTMSYALAAESQAVLKAEAKVKEAKATATALARVPGGVVKSVELEREHGKLVWSFDVGKPSVRGVTEVQVDAMTGKIASVKKETPAQEAREVRAEAKEATAKR